MERIKINTEYIKLDQFLKWSGSTASGAEGKEIIAEGRVKVNGEVEKQRGKKLRRGDVVKVEEKEYQVE